MTEQQAKQVFGSLMQTARKRELTVEEKRALVESRQTLRKFRKPAMNPKPKRSRTSLRTSTRSRTNPSATRVKIYGRILRIEAQKTQPHICDAACKKANHCYYHDFTTKNASIYGNADGSLTVR